jgi:hypothetical protein
MVGIESIALLQPFLFNVNLMVVGLLYYLYMCLFEI